MLEPVVRSVCTNLARRFPALNLRPAPTRVIIFGTLPDYLLAVGMKALRATLSLAFSTTFAGLTRVSVRNEANLKAEHADSI